MFSFLAAEPAKIEQLSAEEQRRRYRRYSIIAYSAVFIGYLAMYLIRKDFNIAQPYLKEMYSLTNMQLGLIASAFTIPYGIGKFVLGFCSDQANAKRMVGVLLLAAALLNICFGFFLGNIGMMMVFWGLNGFFQSAGGPASYATISRWFPHKKRGTALGFWNVSHNAGGAMAAGVALLGLTLFDHNVQGMFFLPGLVALPIAVYAIYAGFSRPEAAGLPSVETYYEEAAERERNSATDTMSALEIVRKYILSNKFVWILCLANIFVYIVRIGLDQWVTVYMPSLGFSKQQASLGFSIFELAAIPGTFLWGWLSDKLGGRRGLVSIICFIPLALVLWLYSHATDIWMLYACLGMMGCLIFGPQLLIGVAIVDFVPKKAIATGNGLTGTFGYLGGDLLAKILLGYLSDAYGWISVFSSMGISIVCGIALMSIILREENRRIRAAREMKLDAA